MIWRFLEDLVKVPEGPVGLRAKAQEGDDLRV
jgi:hypothetical protein